DSIVLRWSDALLQGVRSSRLGPPMVARALAIAHTCMYDAWAAYDHKAVGTRLGSLLRRPPRERTLANLEQAVSFAAYRAAADLFPDSDSAEFGPLMGELGYDAGDRTTDTSTPTGIGNVAAKAVLDLHHRDGANPVWIARIPRAGTGTPPHQRRPDGRAEADRRVLGGRPALRASARPLEPLRAIRRAARPSRRSRARPRARREALLRSHERRL